MAKQLTQKQLNYFKDKLLTEKHKVLEEMDELQQSNLKQSISDSAGEISRYSYHLGDVASLSYRPGTFPWALQSVSRNTLSKSMMHFKELMMAPMEFAR